MQQSTSTNQSVGTTNLEKQTCYAKETLIDSFRTFNECDRLIDVNVAIIKGQLDLRPAGLFSLPHR